MLGFTYRQFHLTSWRPCWCLGLSVSFVYLDLILCLDLLALCENQEHRVRFMYSFKLLSFEWFRLLNNKKSFEFRFFFFNFGHLIQTFLNHNCVRAKRERILIMSISSLYIYIETYRKSSMPSYFRVFWKEALLSCYCRAKGWYRMKNCSNFESSNKLERKLGYFYIRLLYSDNS